MSCGVIYLTISLGSLWRVSLISVKGLVIRFVKLPSFYRTILLSSGNRLSAFA